MRILHTADWHLGNTMHNVDRRGEQEAFLLWLTRIIKERKIDTLLVSGDIFDTYGPPNWAMTNFYRFLASLIGTDCQNVVVVGGNHDSGNLLDAPHDLLNALNIHVVGTIANKKIEDMVFELKNKDGSVYGICAAVPFVPEILLNAYCADRKKCADKAFSDTVYAGLYKAYLEKAQALKKERNIPIIATGHLYAAGLEGRYEGLEEERRTDDGVRQLDVVGNLGKVHVNAFPEEFDYVALGHIHYATMVGNKEKVRYSGSPFVMGFDESDLPHYVLQVDLDKTQDGDEIKDDIKIEKIEVPKQVRFKRLSGTFEEISDQLEKVIKRAKETEDYKQYCLELHYNAEDALALRNLIDDIDFPENVNVVSWHLKEKENDYRVDFGEHNIKSMSTIRPEEIIRQLVLKQSKITKDGLTDEEFKEKQKEEVNKYLPYFMSAFDNALVESAKNGGQDENS